MNYIYLREQIKNRINAYRSILYALENGQLGCVTEEDVRNFVDHPIELKNLIKGQTRNDLIREAKRLKIPNYGRKNTTILKKEILQHEKNEE